MLRVDQIIRACGVGAALIAATISCVPAWAQAPQKKVVSPYARAASQRERVGQAPIGHAPTMVQGMGKPRKPHAGTPSK